MNIIKLFPQIKTYMYNEYIPYFTWVLISAISWFCIKSSEQIVSA